MFWGTFQHVTGSSFDGQLQPVEFRRLYDFWLSLKGSAVLPTQCDLNPLAIGFCLPNLALVDIEPDPFRARYRFVGSKLVELFGEELRNRYVDEVYSGRIKREVMDAYARVARERTPLYSDRRIKLFVHMFGYHRLMLPFAERPNGTEVASVLLGIYPGTHNLRTAKDWRDAAQSDGPCEEAVISDELVAP